MSYKSTTLNTTVILACVMSMFFLACTDKQSSVSRTEHFPSNVAMSISAFDRLPEEIDGCSCCFFRSAEDRQNDSNCILANDFAEKAYMIINDRKEEFKIRRYSDTVAEYDNKDYKLIIHTSSTDSTGYEKTNLRGAIKLILNSDTSTISLWGYCGC